MVNVGLVPVSTYEQALAAVQNEDFQKGLKQPKPPLAKFLVESLEYQNLDPANETEIQEFEKKRAEQEVKKHQIEQLARERGVSRTLLERESHEPPAPPTIQVHGQDFDERVYTNSLEDATARFYAVAQRSRNDRQMGNTFRQHLVEANEHHPNARIVPQHYDIGETITLPETPEQLPDPIREITAMVTSELGSAATGLAGGLVNVAGAAYRNSPNAMQVIQEAVRVTQLYGLPAGRGVLQAAGISGSALGYLMRGTGHALGSTISAANHVLAVTDRRSEHHRGNGVNIAGHIAGALRGNMF
jgi:hypothetical protein